MKMYTFSVLKLRLSLWNFGKFLSYKEGLFCGHQRHEQMQSFVQCLTLLF